WPMALIASVASERAELSLRATVGRASAASELPRRRISSTVRSMRAASKSATTTRAPCLASALAAVLPIPLAPPTTTATLPESAPRGRGWSSTTAGHSIDLRPWFSRSEAVQKSDPGRHRVVELDQHDQADAQARVDDAQQGGQQVQRLGDVDAPADRLHDRLLVLLVEQAVPGGVLGCDKDQG